MLQSLRCRDALGRVYGQHLVDEIFRFGSDCVPLRGGELPKQRDQGERLQGATEGAEAPLQLGWFSCNPLLLPMGQGQIYYWRDSSNWKELPAGKLESWGGGRKVEGPGQDLSVLQSGAETYQRVHLGMAAWPTLSDQSKETCSCLSEFVLVALLEQQTARQGQQERGETMKGGSKTNPLTS